MEYPKIAFTITTFNRLSLFIRTIDTFMNTCLDKDLISDWIIGDDGSSDYDLSQIQSLYPFFTIHKNLKKGQASNLNNIFSKVKTEWLFHCEDDWLFLKKDSYIRKLFDVAFEDRGIKNITLKNYSSMDRRVTRTGIKYSVDYHTSPRDWYGFTLNPGLQHRPTLLSLGMFDEDAEINNRKWDRKTSKAYEDAGYRRANLLEGYIQHIGQDSAYLFRGGSCDIRD